MARNVYSKRFGLGSFYAGGGYEFGGPPLGYVWDLRDMTIAPLESTTPTPTGFSISLVPETGPLVAIYGVTPAYGGQSYHWEGRLIMNLGDLVACTSLDGNTWSIVATGYELSLP